MSKTRPRSRFCAQTFLNLRNFQRHLPGVLAVNNFIEHIDLLRTRKAVIEIYGERLLYQDIKNQSKSQQICKICDFI